MPPLILASTSRYRAQSLERLGIPFSPIAPGTNELPKKGETAERLAPRLAKAKAEAVSQQQGESACVIGSDQAATCMGKVLGKPGTREGAIEQLSHMSGRSVAFVTSVAVIAPGLPRFICETDVTVVRMRRLGLADIERYIDAEPAFDCAGSFKVEGLGISLFDEVQSRDPTALMGLPLIATARALRKVGYSIP